VRKYSDVPGRLDLLQNGPGWGLGTSQTEQGEIWIRWIVALVTEGHRLPA
jgi:hypothetical protein